MVLRDRESSMTEGAERRHPGPRMKSGRANHVAVVPLSATVGVYLVAGGSWEHLVPGGVARFLRQWQIEKDLSHR